jgi:hypothetical protein
VPDDRLVDGVGDDQGQWRARLAECRLQLGGVEEAEGEVLGLPEAAVAVVVDLAGVYRCP